MLDTANYTPRLKAAYRETVRAALKEEFGYANDMMIPRLDKIVLNMENEIEQIADLDATIAAAEGPEIEASDL